jgi:uncharacterized protein YcfJ
LIQSLDQLARVLDYRSVQRRSGRLGTLCNGDDLRCWEKEIERMFTQSRLRVFLPMMLITFLLFGAVSAEAGDRYHRRDRREGDRAAKGALVGAALGALVQLVGGRTEGGQVLKGAVVGGVLGAAVGASQDGRRDRYGRYDYNQDGDYDQNGYYNEDGDYVQVDDGYIQDHDYVDQDVDYGTAGYDSRDDQRYDRQSDHRYDRDSDDGHRHGRRGSHRHGGNCGHH